MRINNKDQTILKICKAVNYNGKQIQLLPIRLPMEVDSYWVEGSKDTFYFLNLQTFEVRKIHSNHPVYERGRSNKIETLPSGFILIEHSIFLGKDCGIKIYCNPSDFSKQLESSKVELSEIEKLVLEMTISYKNSYGGETNIRFKNACEKKKDLNQSEWDKAVDNLISKKLLNKAKSITIEGRNAISKGGF